MNIITDEMKRILREGMRGSFTQGLDHAADLCDILAANAAAQDRQVTDARTRGIMQECYQDAAALIRREIVRSAESLARMDAGANGR